ncbi:hypothetical protein PT279_02695 [Bifidobacterium sp. ESL0784]|nr:hypothetical protein [Bifidobacterium sp. ESL0784]MDF7640500.1 hypothetical protein [Bifidobacterium sp. ESL0784]
MPASVVHDQQVADDSHEHDIGNDAVRLGNQDGSACPDAPQIIIPARSFL